MTMKKPLNYYSYLLRLWRENEAAPWRASLEDAHTGERRSFSDAAKLLVFLREQMQSEPIQEAHEVARSEKTGGLP